MLMRLPCPGTCLDFAARTGDNNAVSPAGANRKGNFVAVLGIGLDLVEIDRIAASLTRFGARFVARVLTRDEAARLPAAPEAAARYCAARFAAKEAGVKALGTGFARGIGPTDLEVRSRATGQPELHFSGAAAARARELGVGRVHLSLTHSRSTAAALVVLEDADQPAPDASTPVSPVDSKKPF